MFICGFHFLFFLDNEKVRDRDKGKKLTKE